MEERVIDIYQKRKLEIAKVVYEASYYQVGPNRITQVDVDHIGELYKQECLAMVPYNGDGEETAAAYDFMLGQVEVVVVDDDDDNDMFEVIVIDDDNNDIVEVMKLSLGWWCIAIMIVLEHPLT